MPEDLLLELDRKLAADGDAATLAALEARKQLLDSEAQAYANEVCARARGLLGAARQLKEGWDLCCRLVAAGHTGEIHTTRDRFLQAFATRLAHLRLAYSLVRFASRTAASELSEAGELAAEIDILGPMLSRLEVRWQSQEDLEDLVAESLAPTSQKLEAVAQRYGGPSTWHRQETERP
jgi:hypothetical protein